MKPQRRSVSCKRRRFAASTLQLSGTPYHRLISFRNEGLFNMKRARVLRLLARNRQLPRSDHTIVFRYRLGSKYLVAGVESLMPALAMKKSVVCCSQLVTVPSEYIRFHSLDVNIFWALNDSLMSAGGVWL